MNKTNTKCFAFGTSVKAVRDASGNVKGLEGYGILFTDASNPDLLGDFFTAKTELGNVKELPLYFNHGFPLVAKNGDGNTEIVPANKSRLGTAEGTVDDNGVYFRMKFFEAIDAAHQEYINDIGKAADAKSLGLSSGAASHLVVREELTNAKGKSVGFIASWPTAELSITPTPAEPKTIGVTSVKSVRNSLQGEDFPDFKSFFCGVLTEEGFKDACARPDEVSVKCGCGCNSCGGKKKPVGSTLSAPKADATNDPDGTEEDEEEGSSLRNDEEDDETMKAVIGLSESDIAAEIAAIEEEKKSVKSVSLMFDSVHESILSHALEAVWWRFTWAIRECVAMDGATVESASTDIDDNCGELARILKELVPALLAIEAGSPVEDMDSESEMEDEGSNLRNDDMYKSFKALKGIVRGAFKSSVKDNTHADYVKRFLKPTLAGDSDKALKALSGVSGRLTAVAALRASKGVKKPYSDAHMAFLVEAYKLLNPHFEATKTASFPVALVPHSVTETKEKPEDNSGNKSHSDTPANTPLLTPEEIQARVKLFRVA